MKAFEEANGVEIPFEIVERRPGDIAEFYANASKAEHELGWKAKRDLVAMCRDAWRFESSAGTLALSGTLGTVNVSHS